MTEPSCLASLVPRLIESLRNELQHYGEMLALLEQQQDHVLTPAADAVLTSVSTINQQMEIIHAARQEREGCQAAIAQALKKKDEPAFAHLIPLLPEKFRGAVRALVRENNELLVRVQQRARQNHLLLSRSLELMQQFLASLIPASPPATYNDRSRIHGTGCHELHQ